MPSPQPSKPFFATLDAIRGVAAILVMMRHVPFFPGLVFQESYLAVDVFFLLSGVVLANAYQVRLQQGLSLLRFSWIRVIRIYPLYLLGSCLSLLAWFQAGLPAWHSLLATLFLGGLLLPKLSGDLLFPLDHPAWSLFFELCANLLYARLAQRLSDSRLRRVMLAIMLVAGLGLGLVLARVAPHNLDLGWTRRTLAYGLLRVAYSFFAGVLLYRAYLVYGSRLAQLLTRSRLTRQSLPWLLIGAVLALLMAGPAPGWQPLFDFVAVLAVFPALIFLALCVAPRGRGAGLARWLGAVSYPVYVLHVPLALLSGPWLEQYCGASSASVRPGLAFVAILLPLCWALNRYFDTPLRQRVQRTAETAYTR